MSYVRIWRTRLDLDRVDEYDQWVEQRSKDMFRAQQGFQAVIYTRSGEHVAVLSFWKDDAALEALETSASYQNAVREITATGFLVGDSQLEVYQIHANALDQSRAELDWLSA